MQSLIGDLFGWLFFFFSTYQLSLAHSTGEGTEALKGNSWWILLPPFLRIFFKKLMTASLCSKQSHALKRNENLIFYPLWCHLAMTIACWFHSQCTASLQMVLSIFHRNESYDLIKKKMISRHAVYIKLPL